MRSILFVLPTNTAQALVLIVAVAIGCKEDPLSTAQILLVNMVTTVGLALPIPFQKGEKARTPAPHRATAPPGLPHGFFRRSGGSPLLTAVTCVVTLCRTCCGVPRATQSVP